MPNRKGSHDIAPAIRHAFLEALKIKQRKTGKNFSEVMADWLDDDWRAVLNAVSKFTVQEKRISATHEHNHKHVTVSESSKLITEALGVGKEGTPKEPLH